MNAIYNNYTRPLLVPKFLSSRGPSSLLRQNALILGPLPRIIKGLLRNLDTCYCSWVVLGRALNRDLIGARIECLGAVLKVEALNCRVPFTAPAKAFVIEFVSVL